MDLTVWTEDLAGAVVVRVVGDLDVATEVEFVARARDLRVASMPRVVVDLTGVTFLDARGIAALVELTRQVNEGGGRLALVAMLTARRLLHLALLDRVITVVNTVEEAVGLVTSVDD